MPTKTVVPDLTSFSGMLVSLGVLLIAAAAIGTWTVVATRGPLTISRAELAHYTPRGAVVIRERQELLAELQATFPYSSGVLVLAGVALAAVGMVGMRRRDALEKRVLHAEVILKEREAGVGEWPVTEPARDPPGDPEALSEVTQVLAAMGWPPSVVAESGSVKPRVAPQRVKPEGPRPQPLPARLRRAARRRALDAIARGAEGCALQRRPVVEDGQPGGALRLDGVLVDECAHGTDVVVRLLMGTIVHRDGVARVAERLRADALRYQASARRWTRAWLVVIVAAAHEAAFADALARELAQFGSLSVVTCADLEQLEVLAEPQADLA